MSLLNSASLVVTPNGYKEGTLYSVIPNTTLGDMTVVRATTATRVNSAGLIELVPYNLVTYSEQFDNAAWSVQDATITANTTTAPNGTLTADTFTRNVNTGFLYSTNPLSLNTNAYSISVYAKANTISSFRLDLGTAGLSQGVTCVFDLSNGTAGTPVLYGSATSFIATIENVGNGWYRCSLSGNVIIGNYYSEFAITTSGSIFIWGAQLEEGSTAKDYQRTETRLNIPRLDYSNGTCPSILVEPQRTNLNFPSIPTQSGGGTLVQNAIISPDGTINANSFVPISNGFIYANVIGTTVQSYTFSLYLKGTVNGQKVRLTADLQGSLATLTLTTEWVRYSVTFTGVSGGQNFYILSGGYLSPSENNLFYFWGWQIEAGSYPTSYIPTTSAAVTRNADAIYKTGISSLIGQTEGTIFCDAYLTGTDTSNGSILIATDKASSGAIIRIIYANGVALRFDVYDGSSFQCLISAGAYNVGDRVKVAGAYKNNDFVMYVNGTQIGTDTSGSVPTTDKVNINTSIYGDTNGSRINSAILFPTRLTNAELISLTS